MKIKIIKDPYGKTGMVGKVFDLSTIQTITIEDPETKEWQSLQFYDHGKEFEFIGNDQVGLTLSEHLKKIKEIIG